MVVGNESNARIALELYNKNVLSSRNKVMPRGWRYLGSGISRTVYLGPDRIAYKVSPQDAGANKLEHKKAKQLRKKEIEFQIPETELYLGGRVLAMEFVERSKTRRYYYGCDCEGDDDCFRLRCAYRVEAAFNKQTRLIDFHSGNCMIGKDGRYYVVDLAI